MDLLLVLLSALALTALGVVADRIDRDLRGRYRMADRADRTAGDRPMRLDLLDRSPEEWARVGSAVGGGAARVAVHIVAPARAGAEAAP